MYINISVTILASIAEDFPTELCRYEDSPTALCGYLFIASRVSPTLSSCFPLSDYFCDLCLIDLSLQCLSPHCHEA